MWVGGWVWVGVGVGVGVGGWVCQYIKLYLGLVAWNILEYNLDPKVLKIILLGNMQLVNLSDNCI